MLPFGKQQEILNSQPHLVWVCYKVQCSGGKGRCSARSRFVGFKLAPLTIRASLLMVQLSLPCQWRVLRTA